ncbi:hypothetical protein [Paenibacillus graminis]|uniref:hypothetical protein n=1 Tax=Paenibacillus graminis TaxID=189425 RepID=UPI002DBD00BE|nr:hypothetical protein [Paenibacillus graminis]MEC0173015.1 hypothetical protein [Paenibacillus graminis]
MSIKKIKYPDLADIFLNCLNRGCTPGQLQDFIDRCRRQYLENQEMLRIIDDLEVRYITSMNLEEGVM